MTANHLNPVFQNWISGYPWLKFNPLFEFVFLCTFVYLKTSIDPDKISQEMSLNS